MFFQVNCLLVFLLVAGSQGYPAPERNEILIVYHGALQTNSKLKGGAKAGLNGALANGSANGNAGGSVSVQGIASVINVAGKKADEYGAKIASSAGGNAKLLGRGKLGLVDSNTLVGKVDTETQSRGEHGSAGGVFHNTYQDALSNYISVSERTANDILKNMDDDEDQY